MLRAQPEVPGPVFRDLPDRAAAEYGKVQPFGGPRGRMRDKKMTILVSTPDIPIGQLMHTPDHGFVQLPGLPDIPSVYGMKGAVIGKKAAAPGSNDNIV